MQKLYAALEQQDARLFAYPIGFSKAATIELDGRYAVYLDCENAMPLSEMMACLCHECGHCATGATHRIAGPCDLIAKHEYKANRWAFEHFLPFDTLQQAMLDGAAQPWQLAEVFGLPQAFIEDAIAYYTGPRQKTFKTR